MEPIMKMHDILRSSRLRDLLARGKYFVSLVQRLSANNTPATTGASAQNVRTGSRLFRWVAMALFPAAETTRAVPNSQTPTPAQRLRRIPLTPWPKHYPSSSLSDRTSLAVAYQGTFISASYSNTAGVRHYKLYVPSGYQGQALPLVVMLHGCTQTPDDFAAGTRMNELAEEYGCLVAYPAQARAANAGRCWNWFDSAHQRRDKGEPALIAGITREIIQKYPVDMQRVYVAGLSAGGAMAAVMGATYSDLYAAVGIHSGLPYAAACDFQSGLNLMRRGPVLLGRRADDGVRALRNTPYVIPTIVFHGDRDTHVHPRNGDHTAADWQDVETIVERGRVPHGRAYTRTVFRDKRQHSVLEQWQVHGAGHAWSGGSKRGSYTDPRGPDAAREMIRFFYEHPLRPGEALRRWFGRAQSK